MRASVTTDAPHNTKFTIHRFSQASSFVLCHVYPASALATTARDDVVGSGRLFRRETTYRVPANKVRGVGGCRACGWTWTAVVELWEPVRVVSDALRRI